MRPILYSLPLIALAGVAHAAFLHPADQNKDEKISRAEWTAFKFEAAQFDKADANRDGAVSGDEFVAWDAAGRGKPKAPAG